MDALMDKQKKLLVVNLIRALFIYLLRPYIYIKEMSK
jgi:hypothetical protein